MSDTPNAGEQQSLDLFAEMNRYDEHEEKWPSSEVYEQPRRTLHNYWAKFHATRDCGAQKVSFVEKTNSRPAGDKYEYYLRCWGCGHEVDEDEVLFIGGGWYSQHGLQIYGRGVEDLWLPEKRVLGLGPDPEKEELRRVLELGRIERGLSFHGLSFGNEQYHECDECGKETYLLFDRRCRMCYEGEFTKRMNQTLQNAVRSLRERNNSFVHRLESNVDPLSIKGRCFEDKILWRRHDEEPAPKLVEVKQVLKDDSDGHWEYILTDPTNTVEKRYRQEDLADCFWDTGLYNQDHTKAVQNEQIANLWERVKDR